MALMGWLLVLMCGVAGCDSGGVGELELTDGGGGGPGGGGGVGGAGGSRGVGGASGDGELPLPPIPPDLAPCDFANLGVRNLWLISHGYVPETGGVRPLAGADWVLFGDPNVSVSFLYPASWTAHALVSSNERGVYIMAPENRGFFEYSLQYLVPRELTSRQLAESKLQGLLAPGAQPRVVCEENATYLDGLGTHATLLVVVSGSDVFYLHTSVVFDPGNLGFGAPGEQVSLTASVRFHAGPLADFTALTQGVWLPIIYQLLSGASSDPDDPDSDGDGYANSVDAFPFDPSRH